ncbi:hypothetical protein LTR05_002039 [Lithohypha guttulata]|uniref:Uncharacterized protein n=1 Tax=Lithohypha guttulata TaxID=1690604 RepID=A0AAN7YIH5_9EURO|nr:hypothetical protein LTR05_002039 [Lithohypha guttulata]
MGDSYRPSYDGDDVRPILFDRPRRDFREEPDRTSIVPTGPRARSTGPSRSLSSAQSPDNINLDGASNALPGASIARSTPTVSPRSPVVPNIDPVLDNKRSSRDPRLRKDGQNTISENLGVISGTNARKLEIETNNTALLDFFRSLAQQAVFEHIQDQNQVRLESLREENDPKHASVDKDARQYREARLKQQEDKLTDISKQIERSTVKQIEAISAMPSGLKDVFRGVLPKQIAGPDSMPTRAQYNPLIGRIAELEERDKARKDELNELRTSKEKEPDLNSRLHSIKQEFEIKLNALGQQLNQLEELNTTLTKHQSTLDNHKERLENQQNAFAEQTQLITRFAPALLISHPSGHPQPETALDKVNSTLKEHKQNFANLSNHFVSRKEHRDLVKDLDTLKFSISSLVIRVDTLQQRLDTQTATTSIANSNSNEIIEMCREFEALKKAKDHYEKFSNDTDSMLQKHETAIEELINKHKVLTAKQDSYGTSLYRPDPRLESAETNISNIRQTLETIQKNGITTPAQLQTELVHCRRVNENRYDSFSTRLETSLNEVIKKQSARNSAVPPTITLTPAVQSQIDRMQQDVNALKFAKGQHDHTIRALSTRYNAISTQHIYKHITAAMTPLAPRLVNVEDAYQHLEARYNSADSDALQMRTDINDLKTLFGEPIAPDATIETRLQAMKEVIDGIADRPRSPDLSEAQIKELEHRIATLETDVGETIGKVTTLQDLCETSRLVCEEVQQNTGTTYGTTTEALDSIRESISELSKKTKEHDDAVTSLRRRHKKISAASQETQKAMTQPEEPTDSQNSATTHLRGDDITHPHTPVAEPQSLPDKKSTARPRRTIDQLEEGLQSAGASNEQPEISPIAGYVVIEQLTSRYTDKRIKQKFDEKIAEKKLPQIEINNIWIRGQKDEITGATSRCALLQVDSGTVDNILSAFEGHEKAWSGRTVKVNKVDARRAREIITSGPTLPVAPLLESTTTMSTRDSPLTPSIAALSKSRESVLSNIDDQLEVDDSQGTTELATRDPLEGWGARIGNVARTSHPRSVPTNTESNRKTTSTTSVNKTKRPRRESTSGGGSSRPSSKRGRHA